MFHRRTFLKSTAAAIASLILPRSLFARSPDHTFHFIHTDTLISWPVADPVEWCLANARQPVLERAAEGLARLTEKDGERVIRLVVRRCSLNLLEVHHDQVVVHRWGRHRADLRPWFKTHGLAHPQIEVVVRDRKKEVATTQQGDSFLYGDRLASDFALNLFQSKWGQRFKQEADDCTAALGTRSGFSWAGVEDGRIPWAALKSAWRRSAATICQNCDTPTILVNFGLRPVGMFNRSPNFVRVCGTCRRTFRDESVKDVAGWMAINLDARRSRASAGSVDLTNLATNWQQRCPCDCNATTMRTGTAWS
jgi:hypothetical protein